jgi:prepilin-type N-terminal cleavage/methylation domain-containing protein
MKKTGFTLIEMMVAVTVFTVMTVVCLSAFLNISNIQRKAEAVRAVNDNLNFSIELMAREIRAGQDYIVGGGGTSLNFTNVDGDTIFYRLSVGRVERSGDGVNFFALTAPEVAITKFLFFIDGEAAGDNKQPRITLVINGLAKNKEGIESKLNLQTTISQRKLDS